MNRPSLFRAALLTLILAGCTSTTGAAKTQLAATASPGATDGILATIPLDVKVDAIAAGPEGVWLRSPSGAVLAVDPLTNKIAHRVEVPASQYGAIAVGSGSVWVTDFDHSRLIRIDPKANAITATLEVGTQPGAMLVTEDTVWVANNRGGSISKVDIATGTVVATFLFTKSGSKGPLGIALVAGDLWTAVTNDHSVFRLDPTDGSAVAKLTIPAKFFGGPISDGKFVYVRTGDDSMVKIDPATNRTVDGFAPALVPDFFGRSAFWGATGRDLLRLNPATMAPSDRWTVFGDPAEKWPEYAIAIDDQAMWLVANQQRLLRIAL
jgi:DNA-binding beta-propeller fold protein YncE